MKKIIPVIALALLSLTGCGVGYDLPEGMEQDTIVSAGLEVVDQLNEGEFEAIWTELRSDIQETTTAQGIEDYFNTMVAPEGAFEKVTDTMATSDVNDDTDEFYAVAVIIASHEEDDILYRIAYDTDMTLIGLAMATT